MCTHVQALAVKMNDQKASFATSRPVSGNSLPSIFTNLHHLSGAAQLLGMDPGPVADPHVWNSVDLKADLTHFVTALRLQIWRKLARHSGC